MARVSLVEAYDNKDVVQQIYRLMETVDGQELDHVDTVSSGNTVTVTLVMKSGNTYPFTFATTAGVTIDTTQEITGKKTFSNADGLTVTHDVEVGGDLHVTDEAEIGNVALEPSGSDEVVSSDGRILFNISGSNELVLNSSGAIVDKLDISTTPTASDASTKAVNKAFVQDTSGTLNNIVHNNQANSFANYTQQFVKDAGQHAVDIHTSSKLSGGSSIYSPDLEFTDGDGVIMAYLRAVSDTSGKVIIQYSLRNADGTYRNVYVGS